MPLVGPGHRPAQAELPAVVRADRDPGHRLHPAGDRDVGEAGADQRGGQRERLLRGTALRVDRGGRHLMRQALGQPGGAGQVERLLPPLGDGPADHLADHGRIHPLGPGPVQDGALRGAEQPGRMDRGPGSVPAADRGARGTDHHHRFLHG